MELCEQRFLSMKFINSVRRRNEKIPNYELNISMFIPISSVRLALSSNALVT